MPPSFAFYNAIKEHHQRFQARMQADQLRAIGFLGGLDKEPKITGYTIDRVANQRQLRLTMSFPTQGRPTEDEIILPIDQDGGPPDGYQVKCLVRYMTDAGERSEAFAGVVEYHGDLWRIRWEGVEYR